MQKVQAVFMVVIDRIWHQSQVEVVLHVLQKLNVVSHTFGVGSLDKIS